MVSFFPAPCPQLPDLQTLLVTGSYHASAPIHLLLSHAFENPDAKAILLTPHRDSLKNTLVESRDKWLDDHGGNGRSSAAAQRTEIFYPPTLAHLRLVLSMLHEYDDTVHHRKTTLEAAPALLVLHELSAYFAAQATQATVSAYLSVVSCALALTSSWSPKSSTVSKLVLFDSGVNQLKLPILPALSFDDQGDSGLEARRGTLLVLLERYVEWKVEFPEDPEDEDEEMSDEEATAGGRSETKSLRLSRMADGGAEEDGEGDDVVWTWTETTVRVDGEGGRQTSFSWLDS